MNAECFQQIPTWFVLLATFGAISLTALIGYGLLLWLAELWIEETK